MATRSLDNAIDHSSPSDVKPKLPRYFWWRRVNGSIRRIIEDLNAGKYSSLRGTPEYDKLVENIAKIIKESDWIDNETLIAALKNEDLCAHFGSHLGDPFGHDFLLKVSTWIEPDYLENRLMEVPEIAESRAKNLFNSFPPHISPAQERNILNRLDWALSNKERTGEHYKRDRGDPGVRTWAIIITAVVSLFYFLSVTPELSMGTFTYQQFFADVVFGPVKLVGALILFVLILAAPVIVYSFLWQAIVKGRSPGTILNKSSELTQLFIIVLMVLVATLYLRGELLHPFGVK